MELTINSKKLGRKIKFSQPGRHYIYVDLNGQPGTLGNQICAGGKLLGSTIGYDGDDQNEFKRVCRNWYRQYLRNETH